MRVSVIAACLSLATLAFAWTKEDHEVFDLVSALEAAEGKGTTFYSWLDLPASASTNDIGKAYRKKSITLHPDKNPGVKNIEERFARLGVIAKILRNKEDRERYDFFYKNGVPVWRGTGYYYARFRPGFGTVLVFLTLVTSGVQHVINQYNRTRDLARIERLVRLAKAAAYGPKGVPVEGRRKVRVPLIGGDAGADEVKGSGRQVDLIVDGTDVYLAGADHEDVLLDESAAPLRTVSDTWAVSLVLSIYTRVTGPKPHAENKVSEEYVDSEDVGTGNDESVPVGVTGRQPASKAGGKRRKTTGKK